MKGFSHPYPVVMTREKKIVQNFDLKLIKCLPKIYNGISIVMPDLWKTYLLIIEKNIQHNLITLVQNKYLKLLHKLKYRKTKNKMYVLNN